MILSIIINNLIIDNIIINLNLTYSESFTGFEEITVDIQRRFLTVGLAGPILPKNKEPIFSKWF